MKLNIVAAIAALGVALSGCASIVEGTTQSIAVTSPPTDGAKCVLKSSEGTYYVTTPGNATVHKTKNDLRQGRIQGCAYHHSVALQRRHSGQHPGRWSNRSGHRCGDRCELQLSDRIRRNDGAG
jgi:uncharacterized protein YceK